jgi:hypothetical protein
MNNSPRRRLLLGRRLQVIRHAPPDEALQAMAEPPTDTLPVFQDPALEVLAAIEALPLEADVSRETTAEPAPPLSPARIARLEALTAQWVRDVRVGGPGPDDTLLYAAPKQLPPVPPGRLEAQADRDLQRDLEAALEETPHQRVVREHVAAVEAARPPARVSAWASRHDPASLEYAVRDRLSRPVPLQDLLLERGPVLDQGTTPPLSVRDASACTGTAAVAAANVLELESSPVYSRPADAPLLGLEDARRAYRRAQELDHVAGVDYAGSSVLAVMKAGQEEGWWDRYLWALGGTRDIAQALLQLRAPVVVGVPWTTGLEEPDRHGVIRPTGTPAGGHALCVIGLRLQLRLHRTDVLPGPFFVLQQSRGEEEGDAGLVYLHHADLARMLAGVGEAAVPLPRWGLT